MKRLVWFDGFPAHYMADFHRQLEQYFEDIHFVYVPLGPRGPDFFHEQLFLPQQVSILQSKNAYWNTWKLLNELNPAPF